MKILFNVCFLISMIFSHRVSAQDFDIVVAKDGSGDFKTIQEAFNSIPDFRKNITRIHLKPGVYKEKLTLAATKTNVHLIGDNVEETVVTYDDFASKKNSFGEELGTTGSSSFFVFGDNFYAKNITFENSSGPVGQAVAVRVDGDKVFFENCRFLGFQDTLYAHGEDSRQYYKNCYIEGTTDFIFGWSTAVFEDCEIYSKEGGHYITAASTDKKSLHGFVFINCKLTGDAPAQSVYLGRPWREYAQTVFINCELGAHIKAEGWHNWDKPAAEENCFYAEYKSVGPGAAPDERVLWSWQLTPDIGEAYTVLNILSGDDKWNPLDVIE
ncbi:pectin esterase [Echinicola marina]|uniref:pectinesterase family protein n=1 Tax=Echinicola marina TaxID=2859768 RepID=UPI001CF6D4C3|nr:pectinesterase family protein [Echinicola marina]UCS92876.1 pectin esterase [Echinicola marina]